MSFNDDSSPQTAHPEADFYLDKNNYADPALDEFAAVERFKTEILPQLAMIEAQRAALIDYQWLEIDYMFRGIETDESEFYRGMNKAYVRQAFKAVETQVEHIMAETFQRPGPLFACKGSPFVAQETINAISQTAEANIEQARLEEETETYVREACKKGLAVAKVVWHERQKANYARKMVPVTDPATGQPTDEQKPELVGQRVFTFRGPTFHNVDIYRWYFHPLTALRIEDYEICHEYFDRSRSQLKASAKAGKYDMAAVIRATEKVDSPSSRYAQQNRDQRLAMDATTTHHVDRPGVYEVCEIYAKFDLYGDEQEIDCKATWVNGELIELRQNPSPDQEPPYITWSPYNVNDHFYRLGMGALLKDHQSILNAIINQALDANLFQNNNMIAIDATRYQGRLTDIEISPFQVFPFTGGPNFDVTKAINFIAPPSTIGPAMQLASMEAGHMQDVIGSQPVLQGKVTSQKMTATQFQGVQAGAQTGVSARARSLALRVLKVWLQKSFKLEQAYRQPDEEVLMTGQMPIKLPWSFFVSQVLWKWFIGDEAMAYLMAVSASMQSQGDGGGDQAAEAGQTNEEAAEDGRRGNPDGVNNPGGNSEAFGSRDMTNGGPGGID